MISSLAACGGDDKSWGKENCWDAQYAYDYGKGAEIKRLKAKEDINDRPCVEPSAAPSPSPSPTPFYRIRKADGFIGDCEISGEVITDPDGTEVLIPHSFKCD